MNRTSNPSKWGRQIIVAWLMIAIAFTCVVVAILFPKINGTILAIVGFVIELLAFIIGNFFADDVKRIRISPVWERRNAILIPAAVIICLAGGIFAAVRTPKYSGQVLSVNLWGDAVLERSQYVAIDPVNGQRYDVPKELSAFPCPSDKQSLCETFTMAGEITNDTPEPIVAVAFNLHIAGNDFPLVFQWDSNCYSNPLTLEPGQTKFVLLLVPDFPQRFNEEIQGQNRAPTVSVIDPSNRRINLVNRVDLGDSVFQRREQSLFEIYKQCQEANSNLGSRPQLSNDDFGIAIGFEAAGIPMTDGLGTFDKLRKVCDVLQRADSSFEDAVSYIREWRPELTDPQRNDMVVMAVIAYCDEAVKKRFQIRPFP